MTAKSPKKSYGIFTTFLLHLHPPLVDKSAIKFTRTFGLGGINALLFIILAITGILLRFSYLPAPEQAYESILNLQNQTFLGGLLRNLHHWSAKLMVVTAFLHLLRVFFTQSIYFERKKNWYYGLLLFAIVLAFNFTGYLLPWDQLSFWAVTVVSNMPSYIPFIGDGLSNFLRGGPEVDGHTLLNFYNLHTSILPLLFVVMMSLHFYLVRKAKGVTVQNPEEREMVKVNPNLVIREALVALALFLGLLIFSMIFAAPLLDYANPLLSPNPIKAPWYFAGMQELLIHIHPTLAILIVPLSLIGFLLWIPNQKINTQNIGKWFYNERGKSLLLYSSLLSAFFTFAIVLVNEYFLTEMLLSGPPLILGLVPFLLYIALTLGIIFFLQMKFKIDKIELFNALFSIIFCSYLILSIISIYFRGINMELIF
ncbi:DUF4405 domain-containing protein [Lentimicrobium sp. L6]|uniref:cytochrome b N-terminal domain-containing protein n=1 Tax=Lentimicrobium sp. L6 TaxID=2735916 RepID=UPI001557E452|nr:cytochrome b N-terminal domain-containing protein [Lentimicrobium sp. L6]NPD84461.1 DUF4405 domain-containing protein [Lentimicrobium sp. L6]